MTTGNVRIVPRNDWDDLTLSVSGTEASGFPVGYTQNTDRGKRLRTTDLTTYVITGTNSANHVASHFSLFRHHLHGASIRVQLYSDVGATTQVYDSGTVAAICYTAPDPYTWSDGTNDPFQSLAPFWLWFSEVTYRAIKVTLSGTPTGYTYYEITRACLGRYFEMAINPTYGLTIGKQTISDKDRSYSGSMLANVWASWRLMGMDLNDIATNELSTWMDILENVGDGVDIVVSGFPGDGTRKEALHTMNGVLVNLNAFGHQISRYTGKIAVEEV